MARITHIGNEMRKIITGSTENKNILGITENKFENSKFVQIFILNVYNKV